MVGFCIEHAPPRIRAGVGLLEASCAATSEALSDRLDGELRGLGRLRVARHLTRCARCRALLASLARLVRTLRSLGEAEADGRGSLVADVLARIREGSQADGRS
jgi:predicted anti-sigma-YlaC factor YlaD